MPRSQPQAKHKLRVPRAKRGRVGIFVGTRKGAFLLGCNSERKDWRVKATHALGQVVHHGVSDPRAPKHVLMTCLDAERGAFLQGSDDGGRTFSEFAKPPAFALPANGLHERKLHHVFWLSPGHAQEPGVWYAGTSPAGLFRSRNGGRTWRPVAGLNQHPQFDEWTGGAADSTPDGPTCHSVRVDPCDAHHLYVALSPGGVFESNNAGRTWSPLNHGTVRSFEELKRHESHEAGAPEVFHEYGQDPHLLAVSPTNPDRLWQQNRTGVYRIDQPGGSWQRVGAQLPAVIGDSGFALLAHPRDPDTAWVFPHDSTSTWTRTAPEGRPALYRTSDGGHSWQRQDRGFPREHAFWSVKRQALAHDAHDPLGLYLGTSQGEVWGSFNQGRSWRCLVSHLPEIYSLEVLGITS